MNESRKASSTLRALSHVDVAQVDKVELVVGKQTQQRLTSTFFRVLALAALMLALGELGQDEEGSCFATVQPDGTVLAQHPTRDSDSPSEWLDMLYRTQEARGAVFESTLGRVAWHIGARQFSGLPIYLTIGHEDAAVQHAWISANDNILLIDLPLITLLLLAALALKSARRRNVRAATELNTHRRQLEAMERLAGNLGQDLQRLLAQVDASIRKLRVEPERTRSHTFAVIAGALEQGKARSRDLFFLGRPPHLVPRVFDVCDWLMETKASWLHSLPNNIAIELHLPNAASSVRVNPAEFETAIFGLILNMKDVVPDGGTISVAVDISGPSATYSRIGTSGELVAIKITSTSTNITGPSDRCSNVMPGGTASTMPGLDYVCKFAEQAEGKFMIPDDGLGCVSFILYLPRYAEAVESQNRAETNDRERHSGNPSTDLKPSIWDTFHRRR